VYILATRGFDVRGACVSVGVGGFAGVGVGAFPPRVTRATAAHRLTQLCAIPGSFAAAQTPFVRTVASTACRFSSVATTLPSCHLDLGPHRSQLRDVRSFSADRGWSDARHQHLVVSSANVGEPATKVYFARVSLAAADGRLFVATNTRLVAY